MHYFCTVFTFFLKNKFVLFHLCFNVSRFTLFHLRECQKVCNRIKITFFRYYFLYFIIYSPSLASNAISIWYTSTVPWFDDGVFLVCFFCLYGFVITVIQKFFSIYFLLFSASCVKITHLQFLLLDHSY